MNATTTYPRESCTPPQHTAAKQQTSNRAISTHDTYVQLATAKQNLLQLQNSLSRNGRGDSKAVKLHVHPIHLGTNMKKENKPKKKYGPSGCVYIYISINQPTNQPTKQTNKTYLLAPLAQTPAQPRPSAARQPSPPPLPPPPPRPLFPLLLLH